MINVRLSEEEYLELERFCMASGARSISDLVRSTIHKVVTSANQESSLASSVIEYSTHVRDLEQRIKELAAELASFRAGTRLQSTDAPEAKDEIAVAQPLTNAEASADSEVVKQPPCNTD